MLGHSAVGHLACGDNAASFRWGWDGIMYQNQWDYWEGGVPGVPGFPVGMAMR